MNTRADDEASKKKSPPWLAPSKRILASIALVWSTLHQQSWAQEAQASIGASLPLSGVQAVYGRELQNGAKACLAATQSTQSTQLQVLDDAGDPARTAQNLRGLAADGKILLALGSLGTESTQAALVVLEEMRLPMVGPSTGSESLRGASSRYVFHLRASHIDEAAAIVNQLAELGMTEAAIVHSADSLGQEGLKGTLTEMTRVALKSSTALPLESSGMLTPAALATLVKASPPAVILIAPQAQAAQFILQLRATALRPTVMAVSEAAGEVLFEKIGTAARGVGLSQVMPHPWSANLPITRFYQAAMKKAGHDKLSYYSFEGCTQVRIALEALRRTARPLSRERLLASLESEFDLGGMHFHFAPGKREGGRFVEMTVITQNGRVAR